jgi:hypothetical protein
MLLWREHTIMRRPYSRTATRRDTPAQGMRNAQVTAGQVKEQAKSLLENSGGPGEVSGHDVIIAH